MQYEYFLQSDLNGNPFIEFKNSFYGLDFLNDFLTVLKEIEPSLRNVDNYWRFDIIQIDELVEDEIKIKWYSFDNYLSIETNSGKIRLEDHMGRTLLLVGDKKTIEKIDSILKNNFMYKNIT